MFVVAITAATVECCLSFRLEGGGREIERFVPADFAKREEASSVCQVQKAPGREGGRGISAMKWIRVWVHAEILGTFEVIVASLQREGAVDCIEQACRFEFASDSSAVVGSPTFQSQAFGYFSHYEDAMQMLEAVHLAWGFGPHSPAPLAADPRQLRRMLPRSPRRSLGWRPLQTAKISVDALKSLKSLRLC